MMFSLLLVIMFITVPLTISDGINNSIISLDIEELPVSESAVCQHRQHRGHNNIRKSHLRNILNLYYIGWLHIGTPPQKVLVLFDTGSADLWVASSSLCSNKTYQTYCKKHRTYDHTKSTSYARDGRRVSIEYVTTTVEGIVGQEDISVSGLQVRGQFFTEALNMSRRLEMLSYDGILGLGFTDTSSIQADPPFMNMIKQKTVENPVFAFYFSKTGKKAELSLGGVDSRRYRGNFTFARLATSNFWAIRVNGISVSSLPQPVANITLTVVDTGTSFILGPPSIIDPINNAIGKLGPGRVFYLVDCDKLDVLPTVNILINGTTFPLKPQDYIQKLEMTPKTFTCRSAFRSADDIDFIVLGVPFIQKYYTQFDFGQNRIGFALAK